MKKGNITLVWGALVCVIVGTFILFNNQANKHALAKSEPAEQNHTSEEQKSMTEIHEFMAKTLQLIDRGLEEKGYKEFGDITMEYDPDEPIINIYTSIESPDENDIKKSVNKILQSKEGKLLISENLSFRIKVYGK